MNSRPNPHLFKPIQIDSIAFMITTEAFYLEECLRLIEAKWQRGSSAEWKSYDFEKLSINICEATGVSLSISTLKRVFGKVSYTNLPSVHTLNTLVRFVGYEDWTTFRQQHAPTPSASVAHPTPASPAAQAAASPVASVPTGPSTVPAPLPPGAIATGNGAPRRTLTHWWPLLLLPITLLGYSLLNRKPGNHPLPGAAFAFTCDKAVSEGVPNSVVFHYKAPVASTDSVFIVQTWDMRRKKAVPANGSEYSSIYYHPGYFNAKLVVDTQIVKTQNLMISSGGWLGLVDNDPIPLYFTREEIRRKEGVAVDSTTLTRYHLPLLPEAPRVRLFYIKEMDGLSDADFSFETTLSNGFNQGSGVCQYVEVLIQCKNDVFIIPLAAKACTGAINLWTPGKGISSQEADLSGFGCDLTQWCTLKVVSIHRQVSFFVNGHQAASVSFPHEPSDIVGVQYRFTGTCAVRSARFTSGDHSISLQ
jgi:hypothetical protein